MSRQIGLDRKLVSVALLAVAGLLVGGCPFVPVDNTPDDGNTLADARQVTWDSPDKSQFTARIDSDSDVDVYDLGELSPGDRLYVDITALTPGLDPVAAVFDEREYLHIFNDDRTPDASDLNPLIDEIIRGPRGHYYLAIAPYPERVVTGDYRVDIEITPGVGLPTPEPQIVYLNWAGGQNVRIENVGVFDIAPFDAADLGPYAGRTEEMKDAIQAVIADRFDGYQLDLRNSDDDPVPSEPHSTIYFGGEDPSAFAIAEQIDVFDQDHSDDAIVFTDGFRGAFATTPSLQQMATAIGNTAAHEIGHLLGLVHTRDCRGLMDTTCANDVLLATQIFKLSPIDETVFPFGLQNAPELLEWAIGTLGN